MSLLGLLHRWHISIETVMGHGAHSTTGVTQRSISRTGRREEGAAVSAVGPWERQFRAQHGYWKVNKFRESVDRSLNPGQQISSVALPSQHLD
jgi:hypothetical protein